MEAQFVAAEFGDAAVTRLAPYVFPDSAWTLCVRRVSAASAACLAARAGAFLSHRWNPDLDRFNTVHSRFTP